MNSPLHSPASLRCGLDALAQFDEIIDVRSPAEYADDHIPGAISAPVLDDKERALIGTIYAQESPFKATRLGAALVARHIADYLETLFADKPRSWRPLVYCWRGGKRSGAMTSWLNQIGWRARQLDGGYKTWRNHVLAGLSTWPEGLHCIILTGPTGSGKTRLLQSLANVGAQTLDLEGLACHRGSLLGDLPDHPQPSQRGFETALHEAIHALQPGVPVFVEAESRRIAFLLQDYRHLFDAPDDFGHKLEQLVGLHSHKTIAGWQDLIARDQRAELFQELVQQHYDPAYRRSSQTHYEGLTQAQDFTYDPTADDHGTQARALMAQLGVDASLSTQEPA